METQEIKLFMAHSTMNLNPRDNLWEGVPVSWYVDREDPPVPYDQVIRFDDINQADPASNYSRFYVNGLFTEDEARSLIAYLEAGGLAVSLTPVELPIRGIAMGDWMLPFSPNREGHMPLSENIGYNLPFSVNGFFRLQHSKTWQEIESSEIEAEPLNAPPMFSQFAQRLCEAIGSESLDIATIDKAVKELGAEGWTILDPGDDSIPF